MLLKKIFITLCFLLSAALSVFAQESTTFDLGEIIVSKSRDGGLVGISDTEITAQEMEARNAQTVEQALDFSSGTRLTIGQKNEPQVMIRGFNQDKVLILLDGIPIASPYYGYVDLSQIPAESISKIKVIKGAASSLYGANAMAGVINIVSKKPGDKPFFEITNSFAEHNTRGHILSYATKHKGTSLWISSSQRVSDGFRLSSDFQPSQNENGGYRDNSDYEKNALSLKLGLERFEGHNLAAFFNLIDNEKGIPAHASSNPRYWRFTEWKRRMFAIADEFSLTDALSLKMRLFYDKYDNTLKSYDDASYTTQTQPSSWTSIYDEYSIGGSVYFYLNPTERHSPKAAINFKKDVHKEQDDSGDPWETYEIHTYSFGLEDNIRLNDKLNLCLGASIDVFDQKKNSEGQKGDSIESLNPVFIAKYSLSPETLIFSSVAKKTHFPSMNQLYSATSGNPNLSEQSNINYEFGVKRDYKSKATIKLTYFYNNVEDLIERASKNDPYLNISEAVFEGFEASLDSKLAEQLASRLSYTMLYARDKNPALLGRTEDEISLVPEHKADFELQYLRDCGFLFSILGSYHGKRYYYDGSNNRQKLGGYFVFNARVSQKFFKDWEASVYLENIFDRNYQEEDGYPQPGRTVSFSIKTRF